jgi:hypothetical protein
MSEIPESVVRDIRRQANYGIARGRDDTPHERAYYRRSTWFHGATGSVVMFTRDTGHHTSGWMKNPDFERCLHLSLSFKEPIDRSPDHLINADVIARLGIFLRQRAFDWALAAQWASLIMHPFAHLSWCEGPFSREGKSVGVHHYRVFCDPAWVPWKPRGEVYNLDFTEKGWRSWSEVQGEDAAPNWVDAS